MPLPVVVDVALGHRLVVAARGVPQPQPLQQLLEDPGEVGAQRGAAGGGAGQAQHHAQPGRAVVAEVQPQVAFALTVGGGQQVVDLGGQPPGDRRVRALQELDGPGHGVEGDRGQAGVAAGRDRRRRGVRGRVRAQPVDQARVTERAQAGGGLEGPAQAQRPGLFGLGRPGLAEMSGQQPPGACGQGLPSGRGVQAAGQGQRRPEVLALGLGRLVERQQHPGGLVGRAHGQVRVAGGGEDAGVAGQRARDLGEGVVFSLFGGAAVVVCADGVVGDGGRAEQVSGAQVGVGQVEAGRGQVPGRFAEVGEVPEPLGQGGGGAGPVSGGGAGGGGLLQQVDQVPLRVGVGAVGQVLAVFGGGVVEGGQGGGVVADAGQAGAVPRGLAGASFAGHGGSSWEGIRGRGGACAVAPPVAGVLMVIAVPAIQ
ncbi:hypothetical protein [Glycomyces salinus]|uniref:hypothetical protein n=1 Tax=Glycomyces salinus TaxID=980294 RepID=UPI0018EC2747